ncbi:LacI family DNA-binding transcriptional regulator [Weissella hellenica]|uniref:LacI family transcriptional regulator n=1 Tax=Weissella hellenica TaxID=46256 RepID=A0A4Y4G8Q5_WEIHE|nr:LacI family DNA-binding transcriptional regulator [Weissella hellenica]NKY66738.1 LacI family transcriptional regulator [Weissella hellenica]GED35998.1 LacI family transcriptional regulator [Weissella hellenica]SCB86640.1 transcriptional regulator, LacI family [Weissella hellenica]
MKPKLEDVAKLAGVSKTTASRVLNNRGYLSDETLKKVHDAMETLNYQPNAAARQLFKRKTGLIGLIFPTVSNPFFGELVNYLEYELYQRDFKVIIGNSLHDINKETDYLNQLLAGQVDGLIVGTHNQGIEEYKYSHLPVVAIDRVVNSDIPIIESDNYKGGVLATQRLINAGVTRIIHTNGPSALETPTQRRREAYEAVMNEYGLEPHTFTIDFSLSFAEKKQRYNELFSIYPDMEALFVSNDVDASIIMTIANERGRKIPEDLLLVGYDGTDLMRNVIPELTTIIQPIENMAKIAVDVLVKRIEGIKTESEYILPVNLWEGKTSSR